MSNIEIERVIEKLEQDLETVKKSKEIAVKSVEYGNYAPRVKSLFEADLARDEEDIAYYKFLLDLAHKYRRGEIR